MTGKGTSIKLTTAGGRVCYIADSETEQVEWLSALEGAVAKIVKQARSLSRRFLALALSPSLPCECALCAGIQKCARGHECQAGALFASSSPASPSLLRVDCLLRVEAARDMIEPVC